MAATANAQIENDDPAERLHDGKGADKGFIIADIASDVPIKPQGHASKQKKKRKAAWVDPDTEKTQINIQDAPRLRKLKASATEGVMHGAQQRHFMMYVRLAAARCPQQACHVCAPVSEHPANV